MEGQKLPLSPRPIRFHLTATAGTPRLQELKTKEEVKEYQEAEELFSKNQDSPKKVTYALKVAMEHLDGIKSSLNELRIFCNNEGLDFDKVLQLNDLNNEVRGYHR